MLERLFFLIILKTAVLFENTDCSILSINHPQPPPPRYGFDEKLQRVSERTFRSPDNNDATNIWEHSGLFEGDIMTYQNGQRNGIRNVAKFWPKGIVPFHIDENDFDGDEIATILSAFQDYHNKTCIRYRPYASDDKNWIVFKGNFSGCWSSVGMREAGQVINLNTPKCVRKGVVLHELLHALGFYHQQSASDRDDFVRINWDNIEKGHENNFLKYNDTHITNYGIEYDYGSIMHYSDKAFSKNGSPTIEPLHCGTKIGQRKELSEKDIKKLTKMYEPTCKSANGDPELKEMDDVLNSFIKWFTQNKKSSKILK